MKYSAFISYRRVGGAEKAELLKAVLCKKGYRAKDIFMDTYTIHTGNYVQNIEQAIAQSKNFIVAHFDDEVEVDIQVNPGWRIVEWSDDRYFDGDHRNLIVEEDLDLIVYLEPLEGYME